MYTTVCLTWNVTILNLYRGLPFTSQIYVHLFSGKMFRPNFEFCQNFQIVWGVLRKKS